MTPLDIYVNWVLHAIYGKLGEADCLMRSYGTEIRLVADWLKARHPIERKPIYRGMLLDPENRDRADYPFVSWSEDRDVACWFADRNSYISEPFREYAPEARGFLAELDRPRSRVLFHHTWRNVFDGPIERFALRHPMMGFEGHRQIAWSLDRQHEVITEPYAKITLVRYEANAARTANLDRKFTPDWIDCQAAPEPDDDKEHRGMSTVPSSVVGRDLKADR